MQFKTFRSQLLWHYAITIGVLTALAIGLVISLFVFFRQADALLARPSELAGISAELNQVHQYVANFVNYDDPEYLDLYRPAVRGLSDRLAAYEATARDLSRSRRDVEFMYAYLEVQKQLVWYEDTADALVERVLADDEERFMRFDRLYDLRDLKGRITSALSDLLFRLMNHTQLMYSEYETTLQFRWIAFFALFGLAVLAVVHWVIRQARAISLPIRHLVAQGRKIASHDFRIDRAPAVRNNELAILNQTFEEMAGAVATSFEVLSERNALERRNLEMEQSLKQAELEILQSQINPHFLFNTLNTITSLAQIEGAEDTERLLTSFSTLLRFNLRTMNRVVPIRKELEIIEHYLFIQKQRFGDRLRYYVDADSSALDAEIPSLTIQPLVENALIHGIEPKRGGGSIAVTVSAECEGCVVVTVCDSGMGMPEDVVARLQSAETAGAEGEHVGLANTLRRLRLYDAALGVQVDTGAGCGTQISLRLHRRPVATPAPA